MGTLRHERRSGTDDQTQFVRVSGVERSAENGPIPVLTPLPLYLDEETLASFAAEHPGKPESHCES